MAQPADILILGIANTPAGHLDQLQAEVEGIRTALAKARLQGLCDPRELNQFTFEKLFQEFNDLNLSGRISMLHYSGHSLASGLLVREGGQDKLLQADKLRLFLEKQQNLRFVFLNSCYSESIAEELSAAGVPVVIGTDSGIQDVAARKIAARFYEILGGSSKTIQQAFDLTQLYFEEHLEEDDSPFRGIEIGGDYPWRLFYKEKTAPQWRLVPESIVDQLERAEGMRKVLVARADSDLAEHFTEGLRTSFSGLPNLMVYDIWELAREGKAERKAGGVKKADVVVYLSTPGLEGALEGQLNWALPLLKEKSKHFILNGSGLLSGNMAYLQQKKLISGQVKVVAEFFNLEAYEKQIDLDTALRGVHGNELLQLFEVGGVKQLLCMAIERLNFDRQKQAFDFDDSARKANFILMEGTAECGHELLIRKILAFNGIKLGGALKPVYFNIEKLMPQGVSEVLLWMALNTEFAGTLSMAPDKAEVCLAISQRLKQQDVVVILDKVKVQKEAVPALKQMVLGLWQALNQYLDAVDTGNRLFMIFAHTGYDPGQCTISQITLDAQNPVCRGLPMPAIEPLDAAVFNSWFIDEGERLPAESRQRIQQHRDVILEKKYIRKVVKEVCELLNCEEVYDEVFQITSQT